MLAICLGTGKPGLGQLNLSLYTLTDANTLHLRNLYSRVDASQTSKLGWSKDTFADTYAPQLPKMASDIF
jgi:hypothetical protein